MRVALVTEYYFPHLGGVTEHVANLAAELRRRGHDALIITSNMTGQGADPDNVRRVGTSRVVFSNGAFARVTTGWGLTRRIAELLRAHRTDVVHMQDLVAPTLALVASSAAWRLGLPVIGTAHSWFPSSIGYRLFRPVLQRRLDRFAARIAVSPPVVDALSRYFRAEWDVIPNGVDAGFFHPNGRHPDDYRRRGPRLLFLGRLDPRNGLDNLLATMPLVLRRYPNARLVVAGDGPLRGHYERRAAALGSSVQFVGRVNGDRPAHYGGADLYLCPSTKASFGITLLEAMACGTPMVVSDITGFRELIDGGQEAVLAPCRDPEVWADTVVALMEDPARREAMAAAGLAKAARFAWPRVTDRILAVYQRVLR